MTMMILKFPSLLLLLLLATVVTPEVITAFVTSPPLSSVVQRRVQSIALNAKTPQQQQQKKRQQRQQPGSELFPTKGSSYVPLGLTADEYAKIKRKEKEELAKMNFGMFGPRFAPSSTPGGDWFLTPKTPKPQNPKTPLVLYFIENHSIERIRIGDEKHVCLLE